MALVLDATVGGATSNAYLTAAEADAYLEGHINAAAWTAATTGAKEQALVAATRRLDQDQWVGGAASTTQALKWPRIWCEDENGNEIAADVIPQEIKDATAELALVLLTQPAYLDGSTLAGYQQVTVGPISVTPLGAGSTANQLPPAVKRLTVMWRRGSGGMPLVRG